MVCRALEIVDQDLSTDPNLVSKQSGVGQFLLEVLLSTDLLTGMSLAGVDEDPVGVGKSLGDVAKQRTLY